jgi:O-Antigen ligase
MKFGMYSIFMFRHRYVDHVILTIVVPLLFFYSDLSAAIIIAICVIGIWDTFGKHRSIRLIDVPSMYASIALSSFALVNYSFYAFLNNDCIWSVPPHIELLMLPFISVGLVLVKQPVRWLALGAKIALGYAAVLALGNLSIAGMRFGYGTNPNIAAYFIVLCSCLCRFDAGKFRRYNFWFCYLGVLPAVVTGSRTVMTIYVFMAVLEIGAIAIRKNGQSTCFGLTKFLLLGALALTTVVVILLQIPNIQSRLTETAIELQNWKNIANINSVSARYVMLLSGIDTFLDSKLFGAGKCQALLSLNTNFSELNANLGFNFFHNMYVDILAYFGLIGIILFIVLGYTLFCATKYRLSNEIGDKDLFERNLGLWFIFLAISIYGMTGSFLSNDKTIGITCLVFGALINENRRAQVWANIKYRQN